MGIGEDALNGEGARNGESARCTEAMLVYIEARL